MTSIDSISFGVMGIPSVTLILSETLFSLSGKGRKDREVALSSSSSHFSAQYLEMFSVRDYDSETGPLNIGFNRRCTGHFVAIDRQSSIESHSILLIHSTFSQIKVFFTNFSDHLSELMVE